MWSIDWFSAKALALSGKPVRRVSWTDKWLVYYRGLWFISTADSALVVATTDFGEAEFRARDWTDQPFNADPCAATPAYNSESPVYGSWTPAPEFLPPPVPGFPST